MSTVNLYVQIHCTPYSRTYPCKKHEHNKDDKKDKKKGNGKRDEEIRSPKHKDDKKDKKKGKGKRDEEARAPKDKDGKKDKKKGGKKVAA